MLCISWICSQAILIRGLFWSDIHKCVLFGSTNVHLHPVKKKNRVIILEYPPLKSRFPVSLERLGTLALLGPLGSHLLALTMAILLGAPPSSPFPIASLSPNPSAPQHLSLHLGYFPFRAIKEKMKHLLYHLHQMQENTTDRTTSLKKM